MKMVLVCVNVKVNGKNLPDKMHFFLLGCIKRPTWHQQILFNVKTALLLAFEAASRESENVSIELDLSGPQVPSFPSWLWNSIMCELLVRPPSIKGPVTLLSDSRLREVVSPIHHLQILWHFGARPLFTNKLLFFQAFNPCSTCSKA